MKNYYYILGLQSHASELEIRTAYKKLSMLFHPDRNGGDKFFEDRFKEVQEAYDTLSQPTRRAIYDEDLQSYLRPQNNSGFNPNPPTILQFESSKKALAEGELLTLMWRVNNADSVLIEPLGLVEPSGTKTIRLPIMLGRPVLVLKLTATNSFLQKSQTREINIQNKSFKQRTETFQLEEQNEIPNKTRYENEAEHEAPIATTKPKASKTAVAVVQPPKKKKAAAKESSIGRGLTGNDISTYLIIVVMVALMIAMAFVVYDLNGAK